MKIFLDKSECLVLDHNDFKNFSIHPLWLRERINNKKFLDKNNYQRLYEPSLLDTNIKFLKYSVCLLYTSPSPRDRQKSRMPSSA